MTANATKSNRSVAGLIKTDSITDPNQYIQDRFHEIEQWRQYWKGKQEEYFERDFDTNAPSVLEANEIRRFLNQFLQHKLDEIKNYEEAEKRRALQFILPFNSAGGIKDFLLHFFQLETQNGKLEYVPRDSFEKEVHILYDIYKIKKTMECIDVMRKTLGNPEKQFKSQFSENEKKKHLVQLREVLKVLFRFSIKPEFQKEIFQNINPDYISGDAILERREKNAFYCYPHVIEKYDYRNLFFLIYFRDGLTAKVGKEPKQFEYNYMIFEVLKQEYLTHWLGQKLKNNPAKKKIYDTYEVDGRTISSWIEEDPEKEIPLLKKLPANKFNTLVESVNENVDEELKADMPSMSETKGEMGDFKKNKNEGAKLAKSPLDKLKSLFGGKKKKKAVEPEPKPEVAAEPEPEPEPEPEWKIKTLKAKQISVFYLTDSASKYKAKLSLIKLKLGGEFQRLGKLADKVLNLYGEDRVVRRRTPKHDWTVPYLIQYVVGEETTDYLFILGGEAAVKPKGMGYATGDDYGFKPYLVFGLAEPDDQYGTPESTREAVGKTFHIYSISNPPVRDKMVEFMEMVFEKEFPGKTLKL